MRAATTTVRAAKAWHGRADARGGGNFRDEIAFARTRNADRRDHLAARRQVVDMPMRGFCRAQMPRDARAQPAGSPRAAAIDEPPRLQAWARRGG